MNNFSKEDITKGIIQYLQTPNTDYAVLLNGKWGTGKTYFVKNDLQESIKKYLYKDFDKEIQERVIPLIYLPLNPPLRLYPQVVVRRSKENKQEILEKYRKREDGYKKKISKIVYISLYGIKSIEELEFKIISKIIGTSSIPLVNFVVNRYGSHLNWLSDLALSFATKQPTVNNLIPFKQQFISLFLNERKFSNLFLILDDLERSSIHVEMLLGFSNSIVEHYENNKILFICDEEKVEEKDKYNEFKEKTIRDTWLYSPNFEVAIESIFSRYRYDTSIFNSLNKNKEIIISLLIKSDCVNLRTVSFIIQKISLCIKILIENNLLNSKFSCVIRTARFENQIYTKYLLEPLIKFVIATSCEVKSGNEHEFLKDWINKPKDYYGGFHRDLKEYLDSMKPDRDKEDPDKELKTNIFKFQKKYFWEEEEKGIPIKVFPSIFNYIEHSSIDKANFLEDFNKNLETSIGDELLFLRYSLALDDNEFLKLKDKVFDRINNDNDTHINDIYKVAEVLLKYSGENFIPYKPDDIAKIIINWIDRIDVNKISSLEPRIYQDLLRITLNDKENRLKQDIAEKIIKKNKSIRKAYRHNKLSLIFDENQNITISEKINRLHELIKTYIEEELVEKELQKNKYPEYLISDFMSPEIAIGFLQNLKQGQYIVDFFHNIEEILLDNKDIEAISKNPDEVKEWQQSNKNNLLWLQKFSKLVENHLASDPSPRPTWGTTRIMLDRLYELMRVEGK